MRGGRKMRMIKQKEREINGGKIDKQANKHDKEGRKEGKKRNETRNNDEDKNAQILLQCASLLHSNMRKDRFNKKS